MRSLALVLALVLLTLGACLDPGDPSQQHADAAVTPDAAIVPAGCLDYIARNYRQLDDAGSCVISWDGPHEQLASAGKMIPFADGEPDATVDTLYTDLDGAVEGVIVFDDNAYPPALCFFVPCEPTIGGNQ